VVLVLHVVFIIIVVASGVVFVVEAIEAVCGDTVVILNIIKVKTFVLANMFSTRTEKGNY
jgi:hypothetical protein